MERIEGLAMGMAILKNPTMAMHAGTWLGLYHNLCSKNGRVILFQDFSLWNLLVDEKCKSVMAIDPGPKYGEYGEGASDILMFISSLLSLALKKMRSPKALINRFMSSYFAVRDADAVKRMCFDEAFVRIERYFTGRVEQLHGPVRLIGVMKLLFLRRYLGTVVRDLLLENLRSKKSGPA